ncbi:OsmC family protein [Brumimicrobium aurantiacum]|uniref:OsmC family peroxiredoxin n=1 Tax=Brumimicrobium aurantiacum TaxID=1737063 RepID=A0A3E1EYX1_9FLAO|nr:OsmC family protein [Brumimicrobium aurantiacum]RFC54657.1 OsmC family peroxiredoxin [Brumimicrobium aurantiacum]
MKKISSSYLGNLRISSLHEKSGTIIETDAPVDNNGKGTRFSPTDLVATAYLNCMITIIGIYCDKNEIEFQDCKGDVEKIMTDNPRRISGLNFVLDLSMNNWNDQEKRRIENAAKNCPVAKSVSSEIKINIEFKY